MSTAKSLVRYIVLLVSTFLMCVVISYENLIWLVYGGVASGIISAVICILSRKNFTISLITDETMPEEGHYVQYVVRLEKKGFCLIPLIELELGGKGIDSEYAAGSLLFNRTADIPIKLKMNSCGMTAVTARAVTVRDFVGAISFDSDKRASSDIAVVPLLRRYTLTPILDKDDGEESTESVSVSITGKPGYEVRPYQDGDSPRSISYKLSAKHGKLLTRISEKGGGRTVRQLIMPSSSNNAARLALGMADHLMKQGMTVTTLYYDEQFTAGAENIEGLRRWLAVQRFNDGRSADISYDSVDFIISDGEIINTAASKLPDSISYAYAESVADM